MHGKRKLYCLVDVSVQRPQTNLAVLACSPCYPDKEAVARLTAMTERYPMDVGQDGWH